MKIQMCINMSKKAQKKKKRDYPRLETGDNVKVPVFDEIHLEYKTILVWKSTMLIEDYIQLMGH